jgi:hypothetical protein
MNILQYSTHFYYVKIAGYVFTFYLVSPEQPTQRKHSRANMPLPPPVLVVLISAGFLPSQKNEKRTGKKKEKRKESGELLRRPAANRTGWTGPSQRRRRVGSRSWKTRCSGSSISTTTNPSDNASKLVRRQPAIALISALCTTASPSDRTKQIW